MRPNISGLDERQAKYPGLPDKENRFPTLGEQMQAVARACSPEKSVDRRLVFRATGMFEGTPSDGGFLVQTDFQTEILNRSYEMGQVLQRVRKIPISSNANGLKLFAINESSRASTRWGGILGYWLAEAGTKTSSKPELREMNFSLKKVAGLCYATDELLQDSTALENIIREGFSQEITYQVENKIILGTGAGTPLGICPAGAAGAATITVNKETGQLADTVVYENICNMWSRLWAPSRANAVWLINQTVEPQLFGMGIAIGTGGNAVYLPPGGASTSPYGTLFGRPVIPIEHADQLGDLGDIILADLSQYALIEKGGVQTAMSIHVNFIYDESVFRFVYRCDGMPMWNAPLTPPYTTITQSPFIVLQARA